MKAVALARLLLIGFGWSAAACAGLRQPTAQDDVSRAVGPPPESWDAAIAFYLQDSTRVEFFDGARTRVVTSRDGIEEALGRTPWYRVHLRDTVVAPLQVRLVFPGAGAATAEYPLTIRRDAFYGVWIGKTGADVRRLIGAREPRSYPLPPTAQSTSSDSLWIYWGARDRKCWTCPH
jgi:hypothetical protein